MEVSPGVGEQVPVSIDYRYWIGFNLVPGIGPIGLKALKDHFGDLSEAWRAAPGQLREAGLRRTAIGNLVRERATLSLDRELAKVRQAGIHLLCWDDEDYPAHLRSIYDPPPLLYVRGEIRPADALAVSLVGTRRATAYGKEATRHLADGLSRSGITIVSGLARGIDAQAHRSALDSGGRTIAVLGSGVDVIYPPEHRSLAAEIIKSGAVVSEYGMGTKPEARNFPPRNRIISGLSLGVIVVEAGQRSGALITADFAADQGRDVFAVPGNIFQRSSAGCNRLLRDGATPALSVASVLEELNLAMVEQQVDVKATVPASDVEIRLLDHLSAEPVHVDELCLAVDLPVAEVSSTLALMELKGQVRQAGGMTYILSREGSIGYRVE